jgi:hypothetical protein
MSKRLPRYDVCIRFCSADIKVARENVTLSKGLYYLQEYSKMIEGGSKLLEGAMFAFLCPTEYTPIITL